MKKETIIKAMIEIIVDATKWHNLEFNYKGCGHAYDNTLWKDLLKDDSDIPNVVASSDTYKIELRSFWGSPELSIYRKVNKNHELLVLNYDDYDYDDNGELINTRDFRVNEVRCDSHGNYKKCIDEIYSYIKRIENYEEQRNCAE